MMAQDDRSEALFCYFRQEDQTPESPRGDAIQMPNCVARVLRARAENGSEFKLCTSRKKCNLDAILVSA